MAARYPDNHEMNDDQVVNNENRGYDIELIDENVKNDFTCAICTFIVRDAVETECGHLFCRLCLSTWERKTKNRGQKITCPMCKTVYSPEKVQHAKAINRIVRSKDCYCRELQQGCPWKGSIADFMEHYKKCPFIIPCPNQRCDKKRIKKSELHKHLETCPFQKIDCPYKDVGCNVEITNIELNKHINDFVHRHNVLLRNELEHERNRHAETRKELEAPPIKRVEKYIEQLKWFEENIDNYETLFKKLIVYIESDKEYFINNCYYYKIKFNESWQKEGLYVFVTDGRSFDELKTDQWTVHHNNNVCVRVVDEFDYVYINLLVEEGWTDDNTRRSIIHPKLHKKVDRYGVCKRDYCDCLVDGFILLQVCRK